MRIKNIFSKEKGNICWICGKIADTSEHTIKKSNLALIHGKGPYKDVTYSKESILSPLQGPNSNKVKYPKNLCSHCNSTFSRPFDIAYEKFVKWVQENKVKIFTDRSIDFAEVFGEDFENHQRNLFKFFAKSLGCRINNIPRRVPRDLRRLLYKEHFYTRLGVSFSINEFLYTKEIDVLGKEDMIGNLNSRGKTFYHLIERFLWLEIHYLYHEKPQENVGAPWVANSRFVYLGFTPTTVDHKEIKVVEGK